MKAPDTKTILNITLIIAIIVVGKKIGEKFGLFKTTEDTAAEELAEGTTADITDTSDKAPAGLALNPLYYTKIWAKIIPKNLSTSDKGKLMVKYLTIPGTNPNKPTDFSALKTDKLWKFLFPPLIIKEILDDSKQASILRQMPYFQQPYAVLCLKLKDTKGLFSDDIDNLNGIFTSLISKLQISFLSATFFKLYGIDLFTYLQTYTNTTEQTKIYKIIKNKPIA